MPSAASKRLRKRPIAAAAGLFAAACNIPVPRLDQRLVDETGNAAKLVPIEGQPPDLVNLPQGCAFRARCRFAVDQCATETPPLMPIPTNSPEPHVSACWQTEVLGAQALSYAMGSVAD